ncbi:cell division protein FtsL [Olsenella sp. YH-ols2217]|uniref:Cell division protein FtsL n=1 Tax=Kribbibacterium absianum TaxID=3044210 RepID=A0ABT6ZMK9_9ACTN|nr:MULTISPECIES: cell division protein FtsL [unclassified Olsenella]MDJ1122099.1 cell division protein FtsL [Olsenella sp. YH-ols2216]MDJ1130107.1 cell division protein FtsL [Olsenella sp. YH-ols2217]
MHYLGSEAVDLYAGTGRERSHGRSVAPRFEVVEGKGLDARAREGVTPRFLQGFVFVLAAVAFVFVLALARVAVTACTVTTLQDNTTLRSQVSEAEDTGKQLRMEASVLSNASRITTIATQNYGMVYVGAGETLTVNVPDAG